MTFDPRRLVPTFRCLMIATVATAAIVSAGCGGENPSKLAGTIEPQARPSTPSNAKAPSKNKVNDTNSNR